MCIHRSIFKIFSWQPKVTSYRCYHKLISWRATFRYCQICWLLVRFITKCLVNFCYICWLSIPSMAGQSMWAERDRSGVGRKLNEWERSGERVWKNRLERERGGSWNGNGAESGSHGNRFEQERKILPLPLRSRALWQTVCSSLLSPYPDHLHPHLSKLQTVLSNMRHPSFGINSLMLSVSLIHILVFHLFTTLHKSDPHCHHHLCHHQSLLLFFSLDLKHTSSSSLFHRRLHHRYSLSWFHGLLAGPFFFWSSVLF